MGDVSIIARRLGDGHVQYGWSGNGGYFRNTGLRLLAWYWNPDDVEYLFSLGQTSQIGQVGSEKGGYSWYESHELTGEPFWLDTTECMIFSKIAFIDYGYFYDTDNQWYYIIPGPFRIKMPLELVYNNTDKDVYEFDFKRKIKSDFMEYIFTDYLKENPDFMNFLEMNGYKPEEILEKTKSNKLDLYDPYNLFKHYKPVFEYFDDWVLVKTNKACTEVEKIIVKKKAEKHMETCDWN